MKARNKQLMLSQILSINFPYSICGFSKSHEFSVSQGVIPLLDCKGGKNLFFIESYSDEKIRIKTILW